MADVIMPQMGESIFEGTITKWLKKAGDKIERDEPLFEISTDKVDAEIPSPAAGVLKEIKVNEGQTVPINTVVAVIEGAGAATAASSSAPARPLRQKQTLRSKLLHRTSRKTKPYKCRRRSHRNPFRPHRRLALPPLAPPRRRNGPAVKKFVARRSYAASRAKIMWTSRKFPARAPADASASRIFARPSRAARLQERRRVLLHALLQVLPRARLRLAPHPLRHPLLVAPTRPRCSKPPSRAKKCTLAITKFSPCP